MSFQLTMMAMLAITVGAAVFVAWPLLFGRTRAEEYLAIERSEPVLQRLLFQRDTVYAAMKELEFDLAMGNLSQEDFQQIQDRYKKKAVAILKRIDDARAGKLRGGRLPEAEDDFLADVYSVARGSGRHEAEDTELDVEQEIQSFRENSREHNGRESRPSRASDAATCSRCGQQVQDPQAAFCSKCGASLRRGSKR